MTRYCERYKIVGRYSSIEDYSKPGEHFMETLPHKRFGCWVGGGGIGQADTIEEARNLIYYYVLGTVVENIRNIETELATNIQARDLLGDNPMCLERFKLLET